MRTAGSTIIRLAWQGGAAAVGETIIDGHVVEIEAKWYGEDYGTPDVIFVYLDGGGALEIPWHSVIEVKYSSQGAVIA